MAVAEIGFEQFDDPGFLGLGRTHPDGRHQLLRFFWRSRKKHANAVGIRRAYLVVCVGLDQDVFEDGRFRNNLVEWPSHERSRRPLQYCQEHGL